MEMMQLQRQIILIYKKLNAVKALEVYFNGKYQSKNSLHYKNSLYFKKAADSGSSCSSSAEESVDARATHSYTTPSIKLPKPLNLTMCLQIANDEAAANHQIESQGPREILGENIMMVLALSTTNSYALEFLETGV